MPQLLGGIETTTFDLCVQLGRMGHEAAVMCELGRHDRVWLTNRIKSRLTQRTFPPDRFQGTRVYRGYGPQTALAEVISDFRPDDLVVPGGSDGAFSLAHQCAATGVPTVFYFHELVSVRKLSDFSALEGIPLIANSAYTAREVRALLGRDSAIVPPLVNAAAYRTSTTRRHVTMVNPRKMKGGQIALEMAQACPDIPFVFVEAWHTHNEFVAGLHEAARALPNVTWHAPTPDMLSIYAGTRVILVPSQWEETWGRVVTEAQVSGIPALASNYGALPESVGPGGLLIPRDAPVADWVRALRRLWDDQPLYNNLSQRALEHAARPEAQPAHAAATFLAALRQSVRQTFQGQSPRASMRS
jgi:glycosyltransferase involved in cell wall biosynthesis